MLSLVIFLIVFLTTQGFLLLEEETLIILASVVWLDAAGSLIKDTLTSEFENKGNIIKEKFTWYLLAKKDLITLLISKYEDRKGLSKDFINLYNAYIGNVLEIGLTNYLNDLSVVSKYEVKEDLVLTGLTVVNDNLLTELDRLLLIVEDKNVGSKDWFSENKPI